MEKEIFKIQKDIIRARALKERAEDDSYGEKVDILFLKNKEERLNTIINKLNDILDKDLN